MRTKYRTIFVSDTHLGMKFSSPLTFLHFLKNHDCETLYLVGDIIDGWSIGTNLKKWSKINSKIIKELMKRSNNGTKIIFLPGNHDEFLRKFIGDFGFIQITNEHVFHALNGKKYLVTHGDMFDDVMIKVKWLAHVGDFFYEVMFNFNSFMNLIRRMIGKKYWSIAQWAKDSVKSIVSFISDFENHLVVHARNKGCDGVICGHIHHAVIKDIDGIEYINCGDWVESLTAVVEDFEGKIFLIKGERYGVG